jgi:hypothetical protein
MSTVSIAVMLIIGAFLIVVNFSEVPLEYVCEGETRLGGPPQKDEGRLRVSDYRWWVGLWGDSHLSKAVFESKKFGRFSTVKLMKNDQGNFSMYLGLDSDQSFLFRRATGELGIQRSRPDKAVETFAGECKEAR